MRKNSQKIFPVLRKLRKKNCAKPRKTHCVSCAKIAQKFAKKNLRENSANFAQKIYPFRGNPTLKSHSLWVTLHQDYILEILKNAQFLNKMLFKRL